MLYYRLLGPKLDIFFPLCNMRLKCFFIYVFNYIGKYWNFILKKQLNIFWVLTFMEKIRIIIGWYWCKLGQVCRNEGYDLIYWNIGMKWMVRWYILTLLPNKLLLRNKPLYKNQAFLLLIRISTYLWIIWQNNIYK